MIILLLCAIACLFAALVISIVQRLALAIRNQSVDVDPLDPISYSRGPL